MNMGATTAIKSVVCAHLNGIALNSAWLSEINQQKLYISIHKMYGYHKRVPCRCVCVYVHIMVNYILFSEFEAFYSKSYYDIYVLMCVDNAMNNNDN